jgi:hypothetical protein
MAAVVGSAMSNSQISHIVNFHGVDSIYAESDDMALTNNRNVGFRV